jgi:hypothetical protein
VYLPIFTFLYDKTIAVTIPSVKPLEKNTYYVCNTFFLLQATHQQTMLIMNNSGLDSNLTSPTVNQSAAEMVIIEEDPPPNP